MSEVNLVYGFGVYTKGLYKSRINGKTRKEYELWVGMLERCYSPTIKQKYPTYNDCRVSTNFLDYQYFAEWCNSQVGFGNKGWHLDKDILIKGNKLYSENTCCFVPAELNGLITKTNALRGELPIGVNYSKTHNKFRAYIIKLGKYCHLGFFDDKIEAFNAYKTAKESYIKERACYYKDLISFNVFNALMEYEVELED